MNQMNPTQDMSLIRKIWAFLQLPSEISDFERRYVQRMNRIAWYFFVLHIPVLTLIATTNQTNPLLAFLFSSLVVVGPWLAQKSFQNPRSVSLIYGVTAMVMGGLLVHFGQGPMQIEMHFYFFALLAMLAVFGNPMVIVTAAVVVAVHHLSIWAIWPSSVFNYDASIWVVLVHASFVVLESIATCFIARSFFDNVIGLEKIVASRTVEIKQKTDEMRAVLDSVTQGLVAIDLAGHIQSDASKSLQHWFGPVAHAPPAQAQLPAQSTTQSITQSITQYFASIDPKYAAWLDMGLQEVRDGFLPLPLLLDQMPKEIRAEHAVYSVEYLPMYAQYPHEEVPQKLLLVVTDITQQLEHQRTEEEQRDLLRVLSHLHRDRRGFLDFLQEAKDIVVSLTKQSVSSQLPTSVVARLLHTLKGNAGIFGLTTFARVCHEIEERIKDDEHQKMSDLDQAWLSSSWQATTKRLESLIGQREEERIEIKKQDLVEVVSLAKEKQIDREVVGALSNWLLDPVAPRLQHLGDAAKTLASRLGKEEPHIYVEAGDLRVNGLLWATFWSSCIHLIRNAVDHGIEDQKTRTAAGKAPFGKISLRAFVEKPSEGSQTKNADPRFMIVIEDDGAGIAWEKIQIKAKSLGIACSTHAEKVAALFCDGVSSKDEVNEISGRGVGMGALYDEVKRRKGTVDIQSQLGIGTTFILSFPVASMTENHAENDDNARQTLAGSGVNTTTSLRKAANS